MEWISSLFNNKKVYWGVGIFAGSAFLLIRKKYRQNQSNKVINEVLFFPDNSTKTFKDLSTLTAQDHYNLSKLTVQDRLHQDSSLRKLLQYLDSTRKSLDLCLFLITCHEFADLALRCQARGVKVRLIVDQSNVSVSGSQVGKLRKAGVFVRSRKQHFLMHHKFGLIDNRLLINGSFNWTRQAIMGNNENVVISNDPMMVNKFLEEFEKLWELFDPDNVEIQDQGLDSASDE